MLSLSLILLAACAIAKPIKRWEYESYFDVQGHRGSRGETVESTLPAFAWALLDGATTLEMDNGLTKDGHLIVWHDEKIDATKCEDTEPAFANDPLFPYVGKNVANLTLAQIKTLDCGSLRLQAFPMQLQYPGVKISTMPQVFDFVKCTGSQVLFNIESKVNPISTNETRAAADFVDAQLKAFQDSGIVDRLTYQSFDWRTIAMSKERLPALLTAALVDDTTVYARSDALEATSGKSDWLNLDVDTFNGTSIGARVAQAANSIGADILSPSAIAYFGNTTALDATYEGYTGFANKSMIDEAHALGMLVKPWTVNRLETVEQLVEWGVDGIITDYPDVVRRWAEQQGLKVAPEGDEEKVLSCLKKLAEYNDSE